jgi:hypothetical protein
LGAADTLTTIQETAVLKVDGLPAMNWVEAQPVTVTSVPEGDYIFGSLARPFLDGYSVPCLMYEIFHRNTGGSFYRRYGLPVEIRAYDINNVLVWSMVHTPESSGGNWDYQYIQLGEYLRVTPGAYNIEIDGTAYGAGVLELVGLNVVPLDCLDPITYASQGMGQGFFNRTTQTVANPFFWLKGATLAGTWAGASLLMPNNLTNLPTSYRVNVFSTTPTAGVNTFTVPLPYRRVIRQDIN